MRCAAAGELLIEIKSQDPAAVLGRAVAVGHGLGVAAGLRETDRLPDVLGLAEL